MYSEQWREEAARIALGAALNLIPHEAHKYLGHLLAGTREEFTMEMFQDTQERLDRMLAERGFKNP